MNVRYPISFPHRAGKREAEIRILTEIEIKEMERENLRAALQMYGWKVSGPGGAAELLGVKSTTLKARIKKMALMKPG